jgi:hypothetical protein
MNSYLPCAHRPATLGESARYNHPCLNCQVEALEARVATLDGKKQAPPAPKGFSFEAEAKKVPQSTDVACWIDSISLTVEMPGKGERFPPGVPAYKLKPGKRYRITIEPLEDTAEPLDRDRAGFVVTPGKAAAKPDDDIPF